MEVAHHPHAHAQTPSLPADNSMHQDGTNDEMMASHRSLDRFMGELMENKAVLPLHTYLIQDNASNLSQSASLSARAANSKKFSLHKHDHLITKEISRWESYPFEVDTPIKVAKPRKIKNGVAPQRRAKRSGMESAGEIKADIIKKAEALPQAPRRRPSVMTDDAKKHNVQNQLLSLFDGNSDGNSSTASSGGSSTISGKKSNANNKYASRGTTPKMPLRRLSVRNDDRKPKPTNNSPQSAKKKTVHEHLMLLNNGSNGPTSSLGQHSEHSKYSTASTETTLSEIGTTRLSDLSSVCSSDFQQAPFTAPSLLDASSSMMKECTVILEEDQTIRSPITTHKSSQSSPSCPPIASMKGNSNNSRMPVRRVSEIPENYDVVDSSMDSDLPLQAITSTPEDTKPQFSSKTADDSMPSLFNSSSASMEGCGGDGEVDDEATHELATTIPPPRRDFSNDSNNDDEDELTAIKRSSLPKKPVRRQSEVPADLIDVHSQTGTSSITKNDGEQGQNRQHRSFSSMEPTALETTAAFDASFSPVMTTNAATTKKEAIHPSLQDVVPGKECSLILETDEEEEESEREPDPDPFQ